jgi:phage terminase large subunit-like protein
MPWVADFIEECAQFPNGVHDDQVDAMTQVLLRWHKLPETVRYTYYCDRSVISRF